MTYKYTVLTSNNPFDVCAQAAAQSYNLNIGDKTQEEKEQYVKKIWDVHTNVSEHFTASILFDEIPRWATFIMALQRHGFSMTELSQRRNVVSDNPKYIELIKNGVKKENARKVLTMDTKSSCVITLNRESAKNIMRMFNMLVPTYAPPPLNEIFLFENDKKNPQFFPDIKIQHSKFSHSTDVYHTEEKNCFKFTMPVYALHQFIRHRTIYIHNILILTKDKSCELCNVRNDDVAFIECSSDNWLQFVETRSTKQTQDDLRIIAQKMKEQDFITQKTKKERPVRNEKRDNETVLQEDALQFGLKQCVDIFRWHGFEMKCVTDGNSVTAVFDGDGEEIRITRKNARALSRALDFAISLGWDGPDSFIFERLSALQYREFELEEDDLVRDRI